MTEEMIDLFNNEGAIFIRNGKVSLCLGIPDVLQVDRFALAIGCGSVTTRMNGITNLYVWNLRKQTEVSIVLERLLPYLRGNKKAKAAAAIKLLTGGREVAK